MATSSKEMTPPKTWEILGAFFGFFAVAKDAPTIFRNFGINYAPGAGLVKSLLFKINPRGDFWLTWLFLLLAVSTLLYLSREDPGQQEDPELAQWRAKATRQMRLYRILRLVRSFGLLWVREKILDLIKVSTYNTFKRPGDWPYLPERMDYIDRFHFTNHNSVEYQYSMGFDNLFVRRNKPGTSAFDLEETRTPEWQDIPLLFVGSNFFPFWYLIHLLTWPLRKLGSYFNANP